jgi:hypothetical protein
MSLWYVTLCAVLSESVAFTWRLVEEASEPIVQGRRFHIPEEHNRYTAART